MSYLLFSRETGWWLISRSNAIYPSYSSLSKPHYSVLFLHIFTIQLRSRTYSFLNYPESRRFSSKFKYFLSFPSKFQRIPTCSFLHMPAEFRHSLKSRKFLIFPAKYSNWPRAFLSLNRPRGWRSAWGWPCLGCFYQACSGSTCSQGSR
jgi:hypothetical protein